jgi:hypothetical protein
MSELLRISIYVLCAATSALCAIMLLRGFARSRARFLLWSSLCFIALFANNLLLMIDRVFIPDVSVFPASWRSAAALVGLSLLVFGLIWDAE